VKKLLPLLFATSFVISLAAQPAYWQQQVNYKIDVSLNDKEHTLTGFEKIEYLNNSPDTLSFIWFHLWPNAYKNDKTAFTDQMLGNGNTKFYFSDKEDKGYINKLDFKVNNITAVLEDHPQHIDIAKLILPAPIAPGQAIIITTPFHVKLPYNFSRGGHDGQSYQCTQWYPKPAVYDKSGWHPMPYLDQGEFYSEFGSFAVNITVPENYVVAATGELQNSTEKEWLKQRSSFDWQPVELKEKTIYGPVKKTIQKFPTSASTSKTLTFLQDNIHDFAWFADKRFIVSYDTCRLSSGKQVEMYTYYTPAYKTKWQESIKYAKDAVRYYSAKVGEYPYKLVQVVQGPPSFGGGMEYPTITVIAPGGNNKELDLTITHEIGHNWFYGVLATNERKNPWMDEGINSFYEDAYKIEKYGAGSKAPQLFFETKSVTKTDQPIADSSESFNADNYYFSVYYKAAEWLRYAETLLGKEIFSKAMQEYYKQWQFKHPQPDDLKQTMESVSGKNLDPLFSLLYTKGNLPNQQRKGGKVVLTIDAQSITKYFKNPVKNLFIVSPVVGVNSYDKFMVGLLATNLKLPPSKFNFLVAPMYASGSKKINGTGGIWYSFAPDGFLKRIDAGVTASRFSADAFTGSDNAKAFLGYQKIVPAVRFTLKNKSPRSTINRFVQFKSFLIKEDALRFYRDTSIVGIDTTITTKFNVTDSRRTLNQLKLVVENYRTLYPYKGELKVEQGKDFVRTSFTGNYFFNYSKGGGLTVRLFAGKFFYTSAKTITKQFNTDRYHLNMTGANGNEDYTYSDYFLGRNKFQEFASQQIMERDGAFKVRTDLLADKVGKTDNWLVATNFSTTIPTAINPLSILPFKVPLKLFADIGTYAEAWEKDSGLDHFLFDAGIQLPLFKESINIYLPLVYSKIYKDYILSTIAKQGRIWKKISFSIDISNFSFRKIDRNLIF
jgi:Peptidase family M1 domain